MTERTLNSANALQRYISSFPREERANVRQRIAARLEVSEVMVRHMANGTRQIPGHRTLDICRATGGAVTPYQLRPELYPDPEWLPPDLAGEEAESA